MTDAAPAQNIIVQNLADQVKPGYQTSEFWMAGITSIITLLNQSGLLGAHQIDPAMVMPVAGMVIAYVISRTVVKR